MYFEKYVTPFLLLITLALNTLSFAEQQNPPSKGTMDGHVTIVEFSDFECSYCAKVQPTISKVLDEYKNEVKLLFRHFPLTHFHKNAFKASLAAEAARKHGKFWTMHDKMFDNQQNIKEEDLLKYAAELKLDIDEFKKAMNSQEVKDIVERDMQLGKEFGVLATPTFFVNGRMFLGNKPIEVFREAIDDALGRKRK
ncbi:MAG: hypothetical protein A2043_01380 [Candidatus Schekmanbacteria bacterium GWA2_38_9]|uniref:Thioredoxin domain-containing protein n=1 Tax=Candidatus Schekmanbacteria bacterium RIFCSPLOWO2_12_FULL_38_15 TaxID=1817883 RepID=A0A1F7SNN0_9BACT|nr:MAG: hypothetical protein A2043_01380 [Candidatus Schekmanbacteria bacterium GWA2_38_9]OGL51033.1 MAG: hypothetical protein A3H37_11210 [Candidatus Schekmanbacteria bacterium RIFCSPLOWO2_02_FULL_38_14]OGL54838.1 MAG: hypothetical protein A3G31_01800 [Candidatus Schekmanbacteria bacterium RIFCSPLOWO2_12_FULL_38_15]